MDFYKKAIPLKLKLMYHESRKTKRLKRDIIYLKKYLHSFKDNKKIYILDSSDYGNLGDQAILLSQLQFLQDHFKNYKIISLGIGRFHDYIETVENEMQVDDIIVLQGGGNFGNQYQVAESTRRTIIQRFNNNKIILFPQTMYFSDDEEGRRELLISKSIYEKHPDLTLVAREKKSYRLMKDSFSKRVILTPDIVLYLNKSKFTVKRKGALFCFRNDIEGVLSPSDKEKAYSHLKQVYEQVSLTDTVGANNFAAVEEKFEQFRSAEIVVTDRLHGMVFAAITGTPCIALSNYNYKVSGTFDWIKHVGYIKFARSVEQIPDYISELRNMEKVHYDNSFALPHYRKIIEAMRTVSP